MSYTPAQFNQLTGTIAPGGTQSQIIDLGSFPLMGLIIAPTTGTLTAGSLQFSVGFTQGTLYPVVDSTNTAVSLSFGTDAQAYSLAALLVLAPYRYVQVTLTAQPNGAKIILPVKL